MANESNQTTGDAWSDDISEDRKAELEARLQAWGQETDHGGRKGPFDTCGLQFMSEEREQLHLTGADVFWLSARVLAGPAGEAGARSGWGNLGCIGCMAEQLRAARDASDAASSLSLRFPALHLETLYCQPLG